MAIPGTPYSATYLLDALKRFVGRSMPADSITDASYYRRLSEAQSGIVADTAAICPHVFYPTVGYSAMPTLTTTDQQTFTFGTDSDGNAISPIGKVGIYPSLDSIPSYPWRAGYDYIPLGTTAIQIPNDNTYTGTLYWRGVTMPGVIDGTHEPVLEPLSSRILIPLRAAVAFLEEGGRNLPLATTYQSRYDREWANWLVTWRTSYRAGGALGNWVPGLQVAAGSSWNLNAGY